MSYNNVKITESVFNAIKTLLKGGANLEECSEYMKVSTSTVSLIKKSATYEEYRQNCYMTSAAYRKKMAAMKAKEEEEKKRIKEEKQKQAKKVAEEVGAVPASEMVKQDPPTQVVEHRQTITVQATHFMDGKLDEIIKLLTVMNNKLGAIIDDLYGTGVKQSE